MGCSSHWPFEVRAEVNLFSPIIDLAVRDVFSRAILTEVTRLRLSCMVRLLCLTLWVISTVTVAKAGQAELADAAERRDRAGVEALLKKHTEVGAAQPDGMTALHWAVQHDDVAMVKSLLRASADVKA